MFSFKSIVLIAAAFAVEAECSGIPAVAAAPLIAPAAVGYAQAIPQNIPPYASQVNVVNRAFSPYLAGPAVAAPLAAPFAAPYTAAPAYPYAPAPYVAGPGPLAAPFVAGPGPLASPYALPGAYPAYGAPAAYAAPFPYSAPLLRSPYLAPSFVR